AGPRARARCAHRVRQNERLQTGMGTSGLGSTGSEESKGSSEAHSRLVKAIQLNCSHGPVRLFPNVNGVFQTQDGRWIHCGLFDACLDLVGWKQETHGSQVIARLVMLECKTGRARLTPGQRNTILMVNRMGGIAAEVRSVADAQRALGLDESTLTG